MTPAFELLRFEATPVSAAAAVVELDGVFAGPAPSRPRLLVESGGVSREMPALESGGSPWSASFAVPLTAVGDPAASFALVPGRGPLVELPAPTTGGGADDDRFVRLARAANDLRHRLSVALDRAEDRDHLAAELAQGRERLAAAEQRVAEAHEAAMRAREEQARAEGEAEEARDALARAREEARAEVREEIEAANRDAAAARTELEEARERAVGAEDEARAARIELRDARARIEALVRESRTARTAATAATARERIATATPRVGTDEDEEFRAARLGPDWGEGAREDEDAESVTLEEDPEAAEEPDALDAVPAEDAPATAELAAVEPAVEPAGEDDDHEDGPSLWRDDEAESVRVLRPRTRAGRRRPLPVVEVPADEEAEDGGDDAGRPGPPDGVSGEPPLRGLDPAAVGARLIRPAETSPRRRAAAMLTGPRVIVGGIFLLLLVALALIFSGAGPV